MEEIVKKEQASMNDIFCILKLNQTHYINL
ncbi:hypothetical protein PCZ31_2645 [Clostridioides difficile]|nr:hypothetical protein PCZ31_2645 [Clostridioides difficile]